MATAVKKLAMGVEGKKALAISAFARALEAMPAIIASNGGFDSAELVRIPPLCEFLQSSMLLTLQSSPICRWRRCRRCTTRATRTRGWTW